MIHFLSSFRRKSVAKIIKKQLEIWSVDLSVFQIINIDAQLFNDVNKLRGYNKYEQLVNVFDATIKQIKRHNKKIEDLNIQFDILLNNHRIDKIISNIDIYTFEQLESYNKIALQIIEYEIPDTFSKKNEYVRYMKDLGGVIGDYQTIVEQYSLIKDFEAISFTFGDTYIDEQTAENVLAPAKNILNKIKAYGTKYYKIPYLDEKIIERHNEQYIQRHLNDTIFNNINGKCLDEDQRRAILCDAKSNLTVAGAGAGKTLTICGKVKWLIENKKIDPSQILLLSYSKESSDDLAVKVKNIDKNLTVKTFHSFGLEVLNHTYGSKRAIEDQFKVYISKYFNEELSKNPRMLRTVFRFFTLYSYAEFTNDKFYATEGEKFEELKTADYRTLKDKLRSLSTNIDNYETLQKESVKSYEELVIANYLYINGIKYEYERAYEFNTSTPQKRQYTPDFYLTDYGVYLEHYGINEYGRAPQYDKSEEKEYLQGIEWKRNTHKSNNTRCIESFSYEFKNGKIFENLKKRLLNSGVMFKPLSEEEISNALHTILCGQEYSSFLNLLTTFLSLYKAQYPNSDGFAKLKNYSFSTNYEKTRALEFLDVCCKVYSYYIENLRIQNKIDFDDMILQATTLLDSTINYRYKYVIVDEFQDISQSRMKFLKKILKHGDAKLFAVGDDWQAIYRFAGCDINIFLQFKQYFDDAKLNFITSTHRNSAELQDIVEPFITANPEQFRKHIHSKIHQESPVRIIYHKKHRAIAFLKALQDIANINETAEVLVLGRNRHDIDCIINAYETGISGYKVPQNKQIIDINKNGEIICKKFPKIKLTYKTVHQSKGLEQDFVILISGENAKNGFPNKMEDDRLLDLVLGNKSGYEYAEERRLFYVALTRTRSIVYILADKDRPSDFVLEISNLVKVTETEETGRFTGEPRHCPYCKSGTLVLHNAGEFLKEFYGCSNFPYCKYKINDKNAVRTNNRCPDCGDFLVIRNGKWGKFIGCHNYPRCAFKRDLR